MSSSDDSDSDHVLIGHIRGGKEHAWEELIGRYEGRLFAFVEGRLHNRAASEDIVQETFVGFLTSLPNFDGRRSLESYLFSICAYKLTDYLRREGRRPALPFSAASSESRGSWDVPGDDRPASSIARSGERRGMEEQAIVASLRDQLDRWRERGDWQKLKCAELLFVRGWANKDVAAELGITEQQVANYKFDFIARMSTTVRKQGLNEDIFPELKGTSSP